MPNYLLIYRGGADDIGDVSPEQMQAVMNRWMEWIGKFMASGHMVSGGDALLPGGKVVSPKGVVSDGPFPETKEVVGGYSIVKAKDYDEAALVAKSCPHLETGGQVEIREMAGLSDAVPK